MWIDNKAQGGGIKITNHTYKVDLFSIKDFDILKKIRFNFQRCKRRKI